MSKQTKRPRVEWPYLQAGVDRGLTETQASILMGVVTDHSGLNEAPRASRSSMLRRCPDLFETISGGWIYPSKAGHALALVMHEAWEAYRREYRR